MPTPFWLEHVKRTSEAHSSLLEWIAEETEKIHVQYKGASSEKVAQLQADEKALDKISALCRMDDREGRQQEEYRRAIGQH